jgi:prolipoprotein diacylglyceryltransferase
LFLHPATAFPYYLHLGGRTIHPHFFFEALSYAVAIYVYLKLRRRFGDPIVTPLRWAAVAAAVAGGALGAKLLFWLEDPRLTFANLHNPAYLVGGKTIVGGLAGGLITVELMKRYIGMRTSTGDLYASPLALGIAIGRIGCFLTGISDNTYGTATSLPWAIDFGDGIRRHPTQLYEVVCLLLLVPFLYRCLKKISSQPSVILSAAVTKQGVVTAESKDPESLAITNGAPGNSLPTLGTRNPALGTVPGDAFRLFMVAYMTFRLLADFIKPYPRIFLGLGGIQWACVLILLYYSRDIARWLGSATRS